ncbi:hypothetical protein [Dubosiella newyorkensis]|uniref:hypothetical protein n=1 Tax=Dubosiella newyorkensis TaxID=1862672 RepID=UPI00272C49F7|nr:hypothetical protein [Dubosiella newyorkensis]
MTDAEIKNILEECDYKLTENSREAIYILRDGSMIDGEIFEGSRTNDHQMIECFMENIDRCHKDFWSRVHTDLGVVMLVPEYKTYMVMEGQKITEQQKEVLKELDYECEVYCEQLPSKDESVQECFEEEEYELD